LSKITSQTNNPQFPNYWYVPRTSPDWEADADWTDVIMMNCPETTPSRAVPVLAISPIPEDHCALRDILSHAPNGIDPSCVFTVSACTTLAAALSALRRHQYEVIVCERDLQPGSWKDVLDQAVILPDPPVLIVTSRFADERLWAEALNLGAYDVLAKPLDRTEAMRVLSAAKRAWGEPRRFLVRRERRKTAAAAHSS
jgi:DNA-binding NtrC family response regulator